MCKQCKPGTLLSFVIGYKVSIIHRYPLHHLFDVFSLPQACNSMGWMWPVWDAVYRTILLTTRNQLLQPFSSMWAKMHNIIAMCMSHKKIARITDRHTDRQTNTTNWLCCTHGITIVSVCLKEHNHRPWCSVVHSQKPLDHSWPSWRLAMHWCSIGWFRSGHI